MPKFPLWKFGYMWQGLEDYQFSPKENIGLPKPTQKSLQERRTDQSANLVLFILTLSTLLVGIALFALARKGNQDFIFSDFLQVPEYFAILCYLFFILSYSIYLGTYYRTIWHPYFSLYEENRNDILRFAIYALFYVLFSIGAMIYDPFIWPLYVVVLFCYLAWIKIPTQRLFCEAVDDYLNTVHVSADVDNLMSSGDAIFQPPWVKQMLSARALAISFTYNFIFWGSFFAGLSIVALAISHWKPTLDGISTQMIVSAGLVSILVIFFIIKTAGGGVRRIRRQLANGEFEGFTVFRWPWS